MTPNELDELVVRKFPLGHPVISVAIKSTNGWRPMTDDPLDFSDASEPDYDLVAIVLDELPDIPPRTGDCAELLADSLPDGAL